MASSIDDLVKGGEAPRLPWRHAIGVVRKRAWLVAAIAVCVPCLAGFWLSKQPKQYEAQTTLVIDSTVPQYLGRDFQDAVDVASSWWTSQETLQTELKVLSSHSQALAVANELCTRHLGNDVAMKRLDPSVSCSNRHDVEGVASRLRAMMRAEPAKDSRIVTMVVAFSDPQVAAFVANTMAQVYTERNLERRLNQEVGAANWLGDEYGDLTEQLKRAENELVEFKKRNNVVAVGIEDQQNDLSSRRKKLAEELNTVDVKLIAVRAQRDSLNSASSDPTSEPLPAIADTPVFQKLKEMYFEQYGKLLELKGKYLEKHPMVVAQQARVESIRSDMQREAQLSLRNFEEQYTTLVKQEKTLRAALDSATRDALQLEQRAIEYNRLKRNFDRLMKLSEQVGGRERETSLAGHLKTNNVRVLDAALTPTAAIAPNVPRGVAAALIVGLLLGLGAAFLLEFVDSTIKSQEDVEHTLGLTFLGLIPRIDFANPDVGSRRRRGEPIVDAVSRDLYVLSHPKSSVAECCRAIRTNLLFSRPDNPPRTLLVTSAGPQEGKTSSAISLAIVMAQSGLRVLLVDTDMRRPRLHKAFSVPAGIDGLSKAIVGEVELDEVVRSTEVPNLWLLPCGATPPNPAEILHADRFKRIIDELSERFDRIIFDSPPVGAVTDAAILARFTDGTILVAKAGQTTRESLARARQIVLDRRVNLIGCILNAVDLSRPTGYGYGYYYSSSKDGYYSSDDEAGTTPSQAVN